MQTRKFDVFFFFFFVFLFITTPMALPVGRFAVGVRRSMQRLAPQAGVPETAAAGQAHRATIFDPFAKRNQNDVDIAARQRPVKRNKQGGEFYAGAAYDVDLANRVVASAQVFGVRKADVARHFGVAPSTVHKYLDRANINQPITKISSSREASGLTRRKLDVAALM